MSKQKMTYQERISKAAQMHADKWNEGVVYADDFKEQLQPEWSNEDCIKDGKVTVAAQAEAVKWALTLPYLDHVISPEFVQQLLLEHGYIEPKTEEDA